MRIQSKSRRADANKEEALSRPGTSSRDSNVSSLTMLGVMQGPFRLIDMISS